jgi:hypothetical protein
MSSIGVFQEFVFNLFLVFLLQKAMDSISVFDNVFELRIYRKTIWNTFGSLENLFEISVDWSIYFRVFLCHIVDSSVVLWNGS